MEAAAAAFPGWSAMAPKARAGYLENGRRDLRRVRRRARPARVGRQRHPDRCERGDERHGHGRGLEERGPRNGGGDRPVRARCSTANTFGITRREPYGVVAVIIPYNMPIAMFCVKVALALAAGNTVVAKPPEQASAGILRLAELLADAFPAGCGQRRRGHGRGRRRVRPARGGPEGDHDRVVGDGQAHPEGGRGHAHAQHLRARWQVAEHRLRRCRPRPRRVRRDDPVDLHLQRRPGLCGRFAHPDPASRARRDADAHPGDRRVHHHRRPARSRHR